MKLPVALESKSTLMECTSLVSVVLISIERIIDVLLKGANGTISLAQAKDVVKECKRELYTGTNKIMICQLPIAC